MTTRPRLLASAICLALLAAAGCSADSVDQQEPVDAANWDQVRSEAEGQTVNFYLYGGDTTLNAFLADTVLPRMKKLGVTVKLVKVDDASKALNAMLGQKQAGKTSGGAVDAVWVNGENFATGVQADLWSCGWSTKLPNAKYVDFTDPAVTHDFGVPVKGCESVWQQAHSALVYDSAKLDPQDVESVDSLFAWAKENPGQFTYPAAPDFTGSMAVRTILYDTIGGPESLNGDFEEKSYTRATSKLWPRLNSIESSLWRRGSTYPQSQQQVERMYADGELAAYFTYGPGIVGDKVAKGTFPSSTREAVLSTGNIGNVSFIGIPKDASHRAGAFVLANLLQDPEIQLALYRAQGVYPAIDLDKTSRKVRAAFESVPTSPSVLPLSEVTENVQPELNSEYVTRLERDWKTLVEQQ